MKSCRFLRDEMFSKELAKNSWKLPFYMGEFALHTLQIIHSSSPRLDGVGRRRARVFKGIRAPASRSRIQSCFPDSSDNVALGKQYGVRAQTYPGNACDTTIQSHPLLNCAGASLPRAARNACADHGWTKERGRIYPLARRHGHFYHVNIVARGLNHAVFSRFRWRDIAIPYAEF